MFGATRALGACAFLCAILPSVHAIPAATPAPTPAPTATTNAPVSPITIAPYMVLTTTVIGGSTYPIVQIGGQGGYSVTGTGYSLSGLLGLTLANNYTTLPGGDVFPVVELVVAEADTESFVIPGVLTFFDGGLTTTGPEPTDILCTVGGGDLVACSGVVGRVTGAVLGVPYTQLGGVFETVTIPQSSGGTFLVTVVPAATAIEGPESDTGSLSLSIATAPGYTGAGLGAYGDGDAIGITFEDKNGTMVAVPFICETKVLGICSTVSL